MSNYCPNCNKTFSDDKVFCTNCGKELIQANNNTGDNASDRIFEEISVIKNKVIWNVPVGEIAYRISEKEMDSLKNVAGVVVDEGVTALIYIDGKLSAEIHGGNYDFISPEEIEKKLNARYGGAVGKFSSIWKFISQFWFGTSLSERMEKKQRIDKITSMDELVATINKDSVYSIILKVDKEFPLLFNKEIQTEQFEGEVGLSLTAQITNFKQFIQYFTLSEYNKNVTNLQVKELFEGLVSESVRHEEFENGKASDESIARIFNRVHTKVENLGTGISVIRVNDCTVDSEDLKRLSSLNREIYLSDREIDRLHNMNIIKNRLANEENQQMLEEARTERDIAKALQEINRDRILDDDDMYAFICTIKNTRILRDARNEDELAQAIEEIEKAKILRRTDIELLITQAAEKKYRSDIAFSLMQLKDSIERENIILRAQQEHETLAVTHRRELESTSMTHQVGLEKIKNSYLDERFLVNLQQQRAAFEESLKERKEESELTHKEALDELDVYGARLDIEERTLSAEHARQMEKLREMQEHQRQLNSERLSHEEKMLQTHSTMNSDQLAALQLSQLDADAQKAFVEGRHKDDIAQAQIKAEREKTEFMEKMFDRIQENSERNQDRMVDVAKYSMDSANNNAYVERKRAEDYKEDLHREQNRYDRHQEQVTGYMLGKREDKKNNVQTPQAQVQPSVLVVPPVSQSPIPTRAVQLVVCPKCGKQNDLAEGNFCAYCREALNKESK